MKIMPWHVLQSVYWRCVVPIILVKVNLLMMKRQSEAIGTRKKKALHMNRWFMQGLGYKRKPSHKGSWGVCEPYGLSNGSNCLAW